MLRPDETADKAITDSATAVNQIHNSAYLVLVG